jgi:hypothetical protein
MLASPVKGRLDLNHSGNRLVHSSCTEQKVVSVSAKPGAEVQRHVLHATWFRCMLIPERASPAAYPILLQLVVRV